MEIAAQAQHLVSLPQSEQASTLVKTLLYFDIFQYPLTLLELIENSQFSNQDQEATQKVVQRLVEQNLIFKQEEYYSVTEGNSIIERRKKGNEEALKKMKAAQRISNFIAQFPFVESVCISGSLSKNYMEQDSDIDFFIITKPHRLWLCRGLLVLFKKVVLLNSRKYFCVNYYLDSNNLEIPDQNIFTATEIVFLKPTYNSTLYTKFRKQNKWCEKFYPNRKWEEARNTDSQVGFFKKLIESLLNGFLGEKMDAFFFKLTLNRWKRKFPHFNKEEFDLNLRSRKNVSKHHPRGYQKIVLESYEKKIKDFEMRYNVKLH